MYFVILFSSSWQSDCVIFSQFKLKSLDLLRSTPKCSGFTCFRWLSWRTLHTLKLLNQVRSRSGSQLIVNPCIHRCTCWSVSSLSAWTDFLSLWFKVSRIIHDNINPFNGVARTLKKLCTSNGDYWIKQWYSSITSLFKMGTSLKEKNLLPLLGANSFL